MLKIVISDIENGKGVPKWYASFVIDYWESYLQGNGH